MTATRRPGDASGARHTSPISPASGPVQGRVNPANPVIGVRSFGADPKAVARLVAAQVAGY
ncbi:hypothetical protein, partial [Streptomyces hygroscopicus]|uniref:hypothetical protein n=1 Tax=Streptomyces hygroscopicus TaxID=1912 RepID=UPI003F4D4995